MVYVLLFLIMVQPCIWVLGVSKTEDRHLGFKSEAKKEKITAMALAF